MLSVRYTFVHFLFKEILQLILFDGFLSGKSQFLKSTPVGLRGILQSGYVPLKLEVVGHLHRTQ